MNELSNHAETRKQSTEKRPNYSARRALVFGGTAVVMAFGMNLLSAKADSVSESAELPSQQDNIESLIALGPDEEFIVREIAQDQITGFALQQYAHELSNIDNLGSAEGQREATFISGEHVDDAVRERTNGSVGAGEKIVTWRDNTTGLIISSTVK